MILLEQNRQPQAGSARILPAQVANHSAGFGPSCPLVDCLPFKIISLTEEFKRSATGGSPNSFFDDESAKDIR